MVEAQIHELISTSDVESDQLRTSATDKRAPGIIWNRELCEVVSRHERTVEESLAWCAL
jgi:hypothetical protein